MADRRPWRAPLWDWDDFTGAIGNLLTSEGDLPIGGIGPWSEGGSLRREEEEGTAASAPPSAGMAALETLDPDSRAAIQAALESQRQAIGYQAVVQQLFPNGVPFTPTPQVAENPELLKAGVTQATEEFMERSTGAILLSNGVIVDTTATPDSGITFPNDDSVPGSPLWLRKVNEWNDQQVGDWRKKLRQLGHPVAKKGEVDAGFLQQLALYHRHKYFYGREVPLDSEGEAGLTDEGPKARDAYDPIEAEFDAKEALMTLFPGMEPPEDKVDHLKRVLIRSVRKAIANGAGVEHARLKGVKALDKQLANDPAAQLAREAQVDEDADSTVHDTVLNAFQILSSL